MTTQAKNCLELFKGNNPETIKRALNIQRSSIVEELKEFTGQKDLDGLAVALSIGAYGSY